MEPRQVGKLSDKDRAETEGAIPQPRWAAAINTFHQSIVTKWEDQPRVHQISQVFLINRKILDFM